MDLFLSHGLARDQYKLAMAANGQIQAWYNFQCCKIGFAPQNLEEGERPKIMAKESFRTSNLPKKNCTWDLPP